MTKFYFTILFLFFHWFLFAQQTGNITGILKDHQNKPVEFANAILLDSKDSSLVKAALTDESGKFIFENIPNGNYLLQASMVGFQRYEAPVSFTGTTVEIPEIILKEGAVNLQEATITAIRPVIEHQVDKTVVNVENSVINAGATAIEILKRSPGVTVDNNGNISLKGKQSVLVLIDNKPTYLSQQDLYMMLKNMQSDQLSKIEIITNPSAKYDAEGNSGIINIRLKKKQNIGFNGSLFASYGQGVYPDFGTGINMNYRNEKFNVFGGYNYGQNFYYEKVKLVRRFQEIGYTSTFDQETFDKARSEYHNVRGGIDYFINRKHTIGFLGKVNLFTTDDKTTSTTLVKNYNPEADSGYTTINTNNGTWDSYSINLNHRFEIDTTGKELTTDIDFARYNNSSNFNFETDYFSPLPGYVPYSEYERNTQPATISIKSIKMDYAQPFSSKVKMEAGVKSSFVTTDNNVSYFITEDQVELPDTTRSNHFKYTENINAAYASVEAGKGKFGLKAGLRVEQTIANGEQYTTSENFKRNYVQLFPSAFLSYKLNDKNQFGLNYSRRIDRPEYQQLNPFKYFIDPKTYFQGNPDLQPQLTNSFELSYTLMDALNIAVNYSHTSQSMTQVSKQIDSTRTTYVTTENLNSQDNYGLAISFPYQVTSWWLTSNSFNLFNNHLNGMVEGGQVDNQLTSYMVNTYNSFKLKNGWTIELSAYYNSPTIYGTFLINPQYSVAGGIGKTFLNNRLHLRIMLNDIFKTETTQSKVKYNNIDYDFHQDLDTQFIRFHVSWSFGKKGVEQARRRKAGSEDEQSRVKTGK